MGRSSRRVLRGPPSGEEVGAARAASDKRPIKTWSRRSTILRFRRAQSRSTTASNTSRCTLGKHGGNQAREFALTRIFKSTEWPQEASGSRSGCEGRRSARNPRSTDCADCPCAGRPCGSRPGCGRREEVGEPMETRATLYGCGCRPERTARRRPDPRAAGGKKRSICSPSVRRRERTSSRRCWNRRCQRRAHTAPTSMS